MKIILFPTDFSENSHHAFRYALELTKKYNAKLILLHVYNLPLVAPVNAFTSREETFRLVDNNLRKAAMENMKIHTDLLNAKEDEYEVMISDGYISDQIKRICSKRGVELVIMGTKGNTNKRDFLMGSTTVSISQKTATPLLAIPESAIYKPLFNMVFATDLIHNTDNELNKLVEFAKVNEAKLTFIHINLAGENVAKELQTLTDFIQNHSYKNLDLVTLDAANVMEGLTGFLKEGKTDLLALSNHTKSKYEALFHKSISHEMILTINIPLLIYSKEVHPIVFI